MADAELSFRITFWSDLTGCLLCLGLVAVLRLQRRAARSGRRGAAAFVILPIYEPILWALSASFLLQTLLLGVPGPYPMVPAWYLGAAYVGDDGGSQVINSALYFFYWFGFELMAEGFGVVLLHRYPSREAFLSTFRYAALYAALSAGLTTLGFNWSLLGQTQSAQRLIDSLFVGTPIALYCILLSCYKYVAARSSLLPYICFSLVWRVSALALLNAGVYSTILGPVLTSIRSTLCPLVMYIALALDTRYWRQLAGRAVSKLDAVAVVVPSGADSPGPASARVVTNSAVGRAQRFSREESFALYAGADGSSYDDQDPDGDTASSPERAADGSASSGSPKPSSTGSKRGISRSQSVAVTSFKGRKVASLPRRAADAGGTSGGEDADVEPDSDNAAAAGPRLSRPKTMSNMHAGRRGSEVRRPRLALVAVTPTGHMKPLAASSSAHLGRPRGASLQVHEERLATAAASSAASTASASLGVAGESTSFSAGKSQAGDATPVLLRPDSFGLFNWSTLRGWRTLWKQQDRVAAAVHHQSNASSSGEQHSKESSNEASIAVADIAPAAAAKAAPAAEADAAPLLANGGSGGSSGSWWGWLWGARRGTAAGTQSSYDDDDRESNDEDLDNLLLLPGVLPDDDNEYRPAQEMLVDPYAGRRGGKRAAGQRQLFNEFQSDNARYLVDFTMVEIGSFLDKGGTSEVFSGRYKGHSVAVKVFRPDCIDEHVIAFFHKENAISAAFQHPCIVRYYGLCVSPPHISLLFEMCERGSLYNVIDSLKDARDQEEQEYQQQLRLQLRKYGKTGGGSGTASGYGSTSSSLSSVRSSRWTLSWRRKLRMACDGAAALAYLHSFDPPYIHRDVKSQNFLITRDYHMKLSDFGESRVSDGAGLPMLSQRGGLGSMDRRRALEAAAAPMTTEIGTTQWMAPEMMRGMEYSEAVDIYGFAIVLWEIAAEAHPYDGLPGDTVVYRVSVQGMRPRIPDGTPPAYADLITACWADDPADRPTASEVLATLQMLQQQLQAKEQGSD